jgi:antirestriction protein ArdC
MSAAVYQKINESIERLLDSGLTFSMPFKTLNGANAQNLISKTPYTGRNAFLMGMAARFYGSPYFVSFKQAQELGGTVKKGEKSWPVVFFAMLEKKGQENVPTVDRDKIPLARWSNVFNIRQCEGIEEPKIESISVLDFSPIEKCESIAASMPNMPKIEHVSGSGAFTGSVLLKMTAAEANGLTVVDGPNTTEQPSGPGNITFFTFTSSTR